MTPEELKKLNLKPGDRIEITLSDTFGLYEGNLPALGYIASPFNPNTRRINVIYQLGSSQYGPEDIMADRITKIERLVINSSP